MDPFVAFLLGVVCGALFMFFVSLILKANDRTSSGSR